MPSNAISLTTHSRRRSSGQGRRTPHSAPRWLSHFSFDRVLFLEKCALHDDAIFQGLFADMVQLPQCRIAFLQALSASNLTELCQQKITSLQQGH